MNPEMKSICLVPKITAVGGPASFQKRFILGAEALGVPVHYDLNREDIGAILVIGAPLRDLPALLRARRRGIPIVHRLNGMNWLHRVRPASALYRLKADLANWRIAALRRFIATRIVYQSVFCRENWNETYGTVPQPTTVIYNGVDTDEFTPDPERAPFRYGIDPIHLLIAEGNIRDGAEVHLDLALRLAEELRRESATPVTLHIAGFVPDSIRENAKRTAVTCCPNVAIEWHGVLSKSDLIALEQKATLLYSIEPQPACPNAVIEALSAGLPVIGFDTGSLRDVVGAGGIIADYGANYRQLESPDFSGLLNAALTVLRDRETFACAAREKAMSAFSLDEMTKKYISFCLAGEVESNC